MPTRTTEDEVRAVQTELSEAPRLNALRLFLLICGLATFTTAAAAQPVTVTNVPNQHYRYSYFAGDCPSGVDIPPGQYPPTDHLERGHKIYNDTTGQWVFWAHFDNGNYSLVATRTSARL